MTHPFHILRLNFFVDYVRRRVELTTHCERHQRVLTWTRPKDATLLKLRHTFTYRSVLCAVTSLIPAHAGAT